MASFILKGLVTNDGIDRLRNGNQRRRKTLPIHDFSERNNSFGHITLYIADIGVNVIIISAVQQRKPKSVRPREILTDLK